MGIEEETKEYVIYNSYQQYIFTPPSIVLLTQQVGFNCDIFPP